MQKIYEELANAVILQAVKDYRSALRQLRMNREDKVALADAMECERFFRSPWYTALTSVDGDYLINRLRGEVAA